MQNSMDIANKVCKSLNLKNNKVGIAGNKDKKAVTFQEISIDANFECIFEMAYEMYDDSIFEVLSKNYEDPLNKFFMSKTKGDDNLEDLSYECLSISMKNYNLINFSNYLMIKILKGDKIERENFIEIRDKIEACSVNIETGSGDILKNGVKGEMEINRNEKEQVSDNSNPSDNYKPCDTKDLSLTNLPYLKSIIQFFDIHRSDIKRLGDLKGNRFTIKLENTSKINTNSKFLNYFGLQRFGKCKNNHFIGEMILNKKYEEAVEMIMKNSKGYESFIKLKQNSFPVDNFKDLTSFCDSTEKYIFMMKIKNKSDKNIIFGLKREIRMIYLHAYQSYFFNESINEEINKNEQKNLPETLPLKKFNDKMLKGGERKVISECFDLKGKKSGNDFIVSFNLCTSSYATIALREILANISETK
ncbi:tRNA pseudouridine synthase D [Nosema bombycis CQ1]|uniref:tRNA pseudouridine synthase D n=1 Tax=Nosema bombycis (strain CQ1 / CVCC 102059) TaxID=578461 RepID=R0M1V0_NOSB1|nr:tRNA pseudouridine synthase D [Nosema bombycis CQ1]|eukprot:EOB12004.1 tRNA pseudouridine synthase D [Nosema bombycis CQ1]